MGPMTDGVGTTDSGRFYDELAGGYDVMTAFEQRLSRERPAFNAFVDAHQIRTAVDAGAGTGLHTLLLSEAGVTVTAVDGSRRMIAALEAHAAARHVTVKTAVADLADTDRNVDAPVDAVFCLGNTLPHCLTPESLKRVLGSFRRAIRPGGLLVVQLLNYRRILREREELLSVREIDGVRFTRRYEFGERLVRFIITREDLRGASPAETMSTDLYPLVDDELQAALKAAGFTRSELRQNILMQSYDSVASKDLLVVSYPD
jgi:glycine/sarcosine N-methyltransferase